MPRLSGAIVAIALTLSWPMPARAQAIVSFPPRVCDVTHYGAKGTRIFADTLAFQRAIDDCTSRGGGTVQVPRGEYLIGPIFLKSRIRLNLAPYSELVAVSDPQAYRAGPGQSFYVTNAGWMALINIADAEDVAITGQGRIDGQGASWWERWRAQVREAVASGGRSGGRSGGTDRPRLIQASRSRNLLFDGIGLYNSPSFHLVVKESQGVTVNGMRFIALAHSPNTDAIDPIDTRDMVITNNLFDVGDDVVAIKSMKVDPARPDASVENIVVRANRVLAGRGICIGSETVGGIRNVRVENNRFEGATYGIRIKTPRGRGGLVQDIVFRNNVMVDVETPIVFSSYYEAAGYDEAAVAAALAANGGFVLGHQIYPGDGDPARPYSAHSTPWIRDVRVEGLVATGADRAGLLIGLPERRMAGIVFSAVHIAARRGLLVRHAQVDARGLSIQSRDGRPIVEQTGAAVRRRQQERWSRSGR